MIKVKQVVISLVAAFALLPAAVLAQEKPQSPYFATYDHYMEETDALEIATSPVLGQAHGINTFLGDLTEFEYGARKWWTTEFYLDWQHTNHEGSVFTGFRFENRFRPFLESHRINPVFYVEYEHLNGADKTLKEIVGFDSKEDLSAPNGETRHEHEREIETKLILSSEIGRWNLSENFVGEKNIHGGPWEFGYAVGLSRPLGKRFGAGVEFYGGLGTWGDFTFRDTSQYVAPLFLWMLPGETVIRISPGWGVTDPSVKTLFRIGVSREFDDIGRKIGKLFHR